MFEIEAADEAFLLGRLKKAEAILVLGAGASASSANRDGKSVKQSKALAQVLAGVAGLPYGNEPLTSVLGASLGTYLTDDKLQEALEQEYLDVTPGEDLERLFNFTWRRLYTWNIDDSLENLSSGGVQRRHIYNGLADKVSTQDEVGHLHIVHLHGQVTKPEHGYILTEDNYSDQLSRGGHDWYRQLTQDYVRNVPIFVGSTLAEPILSSELNRARKERNNGLGRAFLVVPDELSPIVRADLEARNIIHLRGTLSDLANWLETKLGRRSTPRDAMRATGSFASELVETAQIDLRDLETARPIFSVNWAAARAESESMPQEEAAAAARQFLEGAPPTWRIAASDIPVWLSGTDELYEQVSSAIRRRDRLFVVTGQSGSGKTLALMQCLLRRSREEPKTILYDLRGEVRSLRAVLNLIQRLHPEEHVLVYLGDAFLYGDSLAEDVTSTQPGRITIFSSARTGEWRQHIERRVGEWASTFPYQRFMEADYQPLIQRLMAYVPAPRFRRLPMEEKVQRLARSREQLLIALRETTESKKFNRVIADEYNGLTNHASKLLLLIAGVATLPRVGLPEAMAREAYSHLQLALPFEEALRPLAGIVMLNGNGRLVARHELYVRQIIDSTAEIDDIINVVIALLRTYTKFETPISKNVSRFDAVLFKFLLNHNFVYDVAVRRGEEEEAVRVYKAFEVPFQLDGHFWLQYGGCLVELGQMVQALDVLHKSIQAYSSNNYAWHALADVQLRVAASRPHYDSETMELIGDATRILTEQDQSPEMQTEKYAIVTLAHGHVDALVRHGQHDQAKRVARKYFERIEELQRRYRDDALTTARERLFRYLAQGEWFHPQPGRKEKVQRRPRSGSGR